MTSTPTRRRTGTLLLLLALTLGACAGRGEPRTATPGDPLEPSNRAVLDLNLAVDDAVIRPVATAYREVVPAPVRTGLRNVVANLTEPRILVNNLLQGRFLDAGHTTMRLFLNSTAGVGGIFDIATPAGIARRTGDFGQTLHAWGLGDGPYLMLPLAGPSNLRDTFGLVGDGFMNPITYVLPFEANIARTVVDGVDTRERNIENLDALRADSLDFYARLRSVWQQRRDAELGRSRTDAPGDGTPDVLDDPGAAPAGETPAPAVLPAGGDRSAEAGPASRRLRVPVAGSAARPPVTRAARLHAAAPRVVLARAVTPASAPRFAAAARRPAAPARPRAAPP